MKQLRKFIPLLMLPFGLAVQPLCRAQDPLVAPEGTLLRLQLNNNLSTKENKEGDPFTAYVIEPVYQENQVVIMKGSTVSGSISRIVRPGRFKGKAVMHLLFQFIQIPGREKLPILASLVHIDPDVNAEIDSEGRLGGKGSKGSDLGKVVAPGLAGAGIGTLAGGGKGAGIGAGVGVGIGMANVFWTRGKDLKLHVGSTMDISLEQALEIPVKSGP
jgi:hypothetical protein